MRHTSEYTAQQRAGLVAFWLAQGERVTAAQVAAKLHLSPRAAWDLLHNLQKTLPIENKSGHWQAFAVA